ncbi:MAG: hypothetical protein RL112_2181 [Planctomycetota bacterium]|jgi:hypothetical protein
MASRTPWLARAVFSLSSCACVALASCNAAPHGARPLAGASDSVVAPEDLPARERATLAAWRKGGAAWEIERESVRKDPALARFLVQNAAREMVASFERSRLVNQPVKDGPFERAQAELVALPEHSIPLLVESLRVKDGVVAFLAADVLEQIGAAAVEPVLALRVDERAETRRRAIELVGRLPALGAGEGEGEVLARTGELVASDPEWIVRAQAAQSLALRAARCGQTAHAVGVLCRSLRDEDPAVAVAAAEGLAHLAEPRSFERLLAALEAAPARGEPRLVAELERALCAIAGDQRRRSLAEWRAFWQAEGRRLLDQSKKPVGGS